MLVFWDQRLVVLATPKTGSSAIQTALESLAVLAIQRPPVLKHTTVQRYRRFVGPYLEAASGHRFTVVALMREPSDWLGSWYRYRQRDDVTDSPNSTRGLSFDQFVRDYCATPQPAHAAVGSQARFLRPRKDEGVDRLFRYDRISGFVRFLEDRLDCSIVLPEVNVSPKAPLDLSASTGKLLKAQMAEDFALYRSIPED